MSKIDTLSQRSDHASGARINDNLTLLSMELFVVRALECLMAVGEEQDILRDIQKTV